MTNKYKMLTDAVRTSNEALEADIVKKEEVCCFTGEVCSEVVPTKKALKDTFTNRDVIKFQSNFVSADVYFCLSARMEGTNLKGETEPSTYDAAHGRLSPKLVRLLHGGIGVATEGGELLDAIKKHVYYGAELDEINLKEEIGDVFWYLAILCDAIGISFEEAQNANLAKLSTRFNHGFSEQEANNRDLQSERKRLAD